jgi:hypothetical protein
MNRTVLSFALVAALVGGFTADGRAGDTGQCIKGASGDYKDCKAGCKEDFQTAKDACINRDHDCVEACREVRAECRDATGFDAAIKACNATRDDAIANCKQIYPAGSSDRDTCIDDAQVNAFVCRLNERKSAKPALNQCRKDFKTCTVACPAGVGTGEDPKICRHDATTEYKGCLGDCRESFQVDKDACRNLNHDCVENCRTDRNACNDPVQNQLDSDVAVCRATLQGAIAACNGDPMCIEQARVVAFQCRDQARENAKPGFAACRAGFKSCTQACPPASPSGAFLN